VCQWRLILSKDFSQHSCGEETQCLNTKYQHLGSIIWSMLVSAAHVNVICTESELGIWCPGHTDTNVRQLFIIVLEIAVIVGTDIQVRYQGNAKIRITWCPLSLIPPPNGNLLWHSTTDVYSQQPRVTRHYKHSVICGLDNVQSDGRLGWSRATIMSMESSNGECVSAFRSCLYMSRLITGKKVQLTQAHWSWLIFSWCEGMCPWIV
jgi:hypothetical protein